MSLQSGPEEFYHAFKGPGLICKAEFGRSYRRRLKSFSGFMKGSHFVPQRQTAAARRFLGQIAEKEIRELAEESTSSIREAFSYGVLDYELEFDTGGALFECELCNYRCSVEFDPDDLSFACLEERIILARQWTYEEWVSFYEAFGAFERLSLIPVEAIDLAGFAAQVESGPVGSAGYPEISYPGSLERVELLFPDTQSRFSFYSDKIDIFFGFGDDPIEAPWTILSGLLIE